MRSCDTQRGSPRASASLNAICAGSDIIHAGVTRLKRGSYTGHVRAPNAICAGTRALGLPDLLWGSGTVQRGPVVGPVSLFGLLRP